MVGNIQLKEAKFIVGQMYIVVGNGKTYHKVK